MKWIPLSPTGGLSETLEIPRRSRQAGDTPIFVGLWIMPDNASEGTLETFLRFMIPDGSAPLWAHAEASVASARVLGAACRESHTAKAHLYTWLAWQDPPGQSGGKALTQRILNPRSPISEAFVQWFLNLYQL